LSQTENPKEFTTVTILMVKSLVSQEFSWKLGYIIFKERSAEFVWP
jgi:hypothetical protein